MQPPERAEGPSTRETPFAREEAGADAFDQFAGDVKQSMRSNGGLPHFIDGLSVWERVVAVVALASVVFEAFAWAKGQWQSLVERVRGADSVNHDDPGMER